MKFLPFLALRLTHPYYTDGRCPDFTIEPTAETQQLLRNYRCLLKPLTDGIQVIIPTTDAGAPLIALAKGIVFTFLLRLDNPAFPLFTELPSVPAPLYTNVGLPAGKPVQLALVSNPNPNQLKADGAVFAQVEIHYDAAAWPNLTDGPSVFQVAFQAKQTRWKYYLVTNLANAQFQIDDKDASPLTFSPQNRTNLKQQPDAADSTATALATQYPDQQLWRFVSDDLIPCRQMAHKALQLSLNGNQVMGALPNPALTNYTLDTLGNDAQQKVNSLFQVVKYFTQ